MKENIIQKKSFDFAIRVVKAYQHLVENKREFVLSTQFLRSGTSIGANVEEAIGAQSSADFLAKLAISYKEARETNYWIRLMSETGYFTQEESDSILSDVVELQKIISKIRITTKANNNN